MQFSSEEVKAMKAFYEQELSSTLERLKHIQGVLTKIGGSQISVEINLGSTASRPNQASAKTVKKTTKAKRGAKRGPKSIWGNFVMKKLKELDKPLTYEELIEEAMKFANVPPENAQKIRQSIINVTFRLRTNDRKIDTFSKGSRIKYVALKSWFDDQGKIDPAYAKKASNVKPKPTKRKKSTATRPKATSKKSVSPAKPRVKKPAQKKPVTTTS
ncbi:MAG: hypothetical protein RLP15_13385 [Cryomorphaceae bacterium]